MDEERARALPWETAHRVLQAAAVETYAGPGAYVTQDRLMQREEHMADTERFKVIAEYLEHRGWIAKAGADYRVSLS